MRRKLLWMATCILLAYNDGYSQNKIALSVYAGSGVSCFKGSGAVSRSDYHRNGLIFPNAVDSMANHFGRNAGGNFLAGLQLEYPVSKKWSLLLNTQYEHTGAALKADSVITPGGNFKTDGDYRINYFFVSINPQLARHFEKGNTRISIHSGFEYSLGINWSDQFDFTDQTGKKFSIGHSGGDPEVNDFRFSIGTTVQINKWGLGINYKHGLSNFNKGHSDKALMRLLQMKISYLLFGKFQTITPKIP